MSQLTLPELCMKKELSGKRVKDFKRSAQDETPIRDFQTEI